MKLASKTLLAGIAILGIVGSAQGALITATTLTNESQIVNTGGTVVSAVNLGSVSGGGVDATVNGILHKIASASDGGSGSDLIPELTINSGFDGQYRNTPSFTGGLNALFRGIAGTSGTITANVTGLTVGTTYLFQAYWEAAGNNQLATAVIEGDTLAGIDGNTPQLISYQFTATDDTLNFGLTKNAGSDNIWFHGYSLQAVSIPEPGSWALLSLAGLGLIMFQRRDDAIGA